MHSGTVYSITSKEWAACRGHGVWQGAGPDAAASFESGRGYQALGLAAGSAAAACRRLLPPPVATASSSHSRPRQLSHPSLDPQEQAVSFLGTIVNVLSRLPALEDATCYGALASLPGLPRLLLAKQLSALEDLISQLQQQVDELQAVADSIERHAAAARRFVKQDRALTPAVCAVSAGPVPSIDQCLQGLADIRRGWRAGLSQGCCGWLRGCLGQPNGTASRRRQPLHCRPTVHQALPSRSPCLHELLLNSSHLPLSPIPSAACMRRRCD